jgi:tetratricopeptide (TPR) repeat protein
MTQSAAEFVDFYALLDIDPGADGATVDQALHRAHRRWGARQNSPDPEKRAEAEGTVRRLTEAERVLGDAARRAAYDREWAARRDAPAPEEARQPVAQATSGAAPAGSLADEWISQTRQLLAAGAAAAARVAATKAVQADPANSGSWWVLALSSVLGGNDVQAIAEYGEAAKLAPENVGLRLDEARCYMRLGRYNDAVTLLGFVSRLAPHDDTAPRLIIECCLTAGQPEAALPIAEQRADAHPGDENAQQTLAATLLAVAQTRLTQTGPSTYMPTSQEQIEAARELLTRAAGLRFTDAPLHAEIASWLTFLERARQRKYVKPANWWPWICGVVFAWLLLGTSGWTGEVLGFLVLLGVGYGFYHRRWRPQWEHNARSLPGP